jgi:signal transduction histidine kinase
LASDSDTSKFLSVIDGECRRLTGLIDNVLDFTRIEQGRRQYAMQEVDLTEMIREAVTAMQYQFDISHCEYDLKFHCSACRVSVDPAAIQEALINVLSNAIKYNRDPKRVIIRIQRDRFGARISVQDFGAGISAEDMPQLFEPFFRSPEMHIQRQGGVGLGLSLVQHIMIAHGGAIDVQSIPGRGSTFSLILPMQEVV